jgi:hypothetical protein
LYGLASSDSESDDDQHVPGSSKKLWEMLKQISAPGRAVNAAAAAAGSDSAAAGCPAGSSRNSFISPKLQEEVDRLRVLVERDVEQLRANWQQRELAGLQQKAADIWQT